MRSSKSRSRNKNNRNRSVGNVVNRVFDSSGPEGKVRGTPQQIIDKYNQLARDAQLANDRVATENFQQHAEHYLRLLAEAQREQQERQQQQQAQNEARQKRQQSEDEQPETESPSGEPAYASVFESLLNALRAPDIRRRQQATTSRSPWSGRVWVTCIGTSANRRWVSCAAKREHHLTGRAWCYVSTM